VAGFLGDHLVGIGKVVDGFGGYLLLSIGTIAAGYLQWFVVLPLLWRWWCAQRSGSRMKS